MFSYEIFQGGRHQKIYVHIRLYQGESEHFVSDLSHFHTTPHSNTLNGEKVNVILELPVINKSK